MPVRLSITGGNWAMICVTSPVSLLAPPPAPLPELMMTIFSVLDSGSLILPATSGSTRTIISITAASLYCLKDSALTRIASAVALPCASMTAASARPRALFASASAIPVALDNVGARKTGGLGGGRRAGGLGFQLELPGVGQRLDLVALGVGGLLHVGFQFALFAHDFLLLQLDLLLLLDDLHLHFLGLHELAGLVFLQIVGEVGLGLLLVHRRLVLRHVRLIIALRLGDLGVGGELGFLPGLRGLRRLDHRVAVGLGLGDLRRRV